MSAPAHRRKAGQQGCFLTFLTRKCIFQSAAIDNLHDFEYD